MSHTEVQSSDSILEGEEEERGERNEDSTIK
jgi:hypothetical protein